MSEVQSVLLNKKSYDLYEALSFIYRHDFSAKKIDETKNYYRFRQYDPKSFKHLRAKKVSEGVTLIIGYN